MTAPDTIAAIDLGSNSFHMVIARVRDGEPQIVDRHKEMVRLAAGLDAERMLTPAAEERALGCLARFGDRLRDIRGDALRVVGTNTLRQARNARDFTVRAEAVLGHPIEVISGLEEARLVYLGVTHSVTRGLYKGRRLVIDIGGGSTECIVGEGFDPIDAHSLYMGCVTWSERFFPKGRITEKRMRRAELEAAVELEPITNWYRNLAWRTCIGSSGTILAIDDVLHANAWSEGGITLQGLQRLEARLVEVGQTERLAEQIQGLKPERAEVLPGGLAILKSAFQTLHIAHMDASDGALREGVLYDMLGRFSTDDTRETTVARVAGRYHVDSIQAARVTSLALGLFEQLREPWGMDATVMPRMLRWASGLHEVGLALSYTGYQKHGAYIIENSHMPGFSKDEQRALAAIVGQHRRKMRKQVFDELGAERGPLALRLCLVLRVAVQLSRSRSDEAIPAIVATTRSSAVDLVFPEGWITAHPLAEADLREEAVNWERVGWSLVYR